MQLDRPRRTSREMAGFRGKVRRVLHRMDGQPVVREILFDDGGMLAGQVAQPEVHLSAMPSGTEFRRNQRIAGLDWWGPPDVEIGLPTFGAATASTYFGLAGEALRTDFVSDDERVLSTVVYVADEQGRIQELTQYIKEAAPPHEALASIFTRGAKHITVSLTRDSAGNIVPEEH